MRIQIQLYAAARELAGQDRVELDLAHALATPINNNSQSTHALATPINNNSQSTHALSPVNNPTVRQLRQALAEQIPALALLLPQVLFALDAEYATDDTPLASDIEIACIPPVSGG